MKYKNISTFTKRIQGQEIPAGGIADLTGNVNDAWLVRLPEQEESPAETAEETATAEIEEPKQKRKYTKNSNQDGEN